MPAPKRPRKKTMSKEKEAFDQWLRQVFGPRLVTEYKFHPTRKWKFDYALLAEKIGIEFDGLYGGGAHTSPAMVAKDSEKINQAQLHGWVVIRANANSVRSGQAFRDVMQAVVMRQLERDDDAA